MDGVSSVLRTGRNNIFLITCVANVCDQLQRKYKEKLSTEIEDQGSLCPVLKSSNTENYFFAISYCSVCDLYSSPNIVRMIKSRRMRWAGHVARMGEERRCTGSWWGNRRERDHWRDLGVDGWIILGWISRRWDVGIWTG